ncbi:DUF7146 domain-containing protein [Azospirillum sp. sgz302134]
MKVVTIDADKVRQEVEGRWGEVLDKLAPSLKHALRLAPRHCACPVCGGKDRFRIYRDLAKRGGAYCNQCVNPRTGKLGFGNGFDLLMWVNNWSFPETLEEVARVVGVSPEQAPPRNNDRRREPKPPRVERRIEPVFDQAEEAAAIQRIRNRQMEMWKAALPLSHPDAIAGRLYLFNRGLNSIPWEKDPQVRLHPALPYWEAGPSGKLRKVGEFPCLLFRVLDGNGLTVTLHRIYLTPDGQKAPVDEPKKLMEVPKDRSMIGSAIRLGGVGPVLGIAEGPETALAVHLATGMPVWSAVSAAFLPYVFPVTEETETVQEPQERKGFVARVTSLVRRPEPVRQVKRSGVILPEGVEAVAIWADLDRSQAGEAAAKDLKRVLMTGGVQTQIWLPPVSLPDGVKSVDWLDVFVELGRSGFPRSALAQQLRVA